VVVVDHLIIEVALAFRALVVLVAVELVVPKIQLEQQVLQV
jgi:hypothetical protein